MKNGSGTFYVVFLIILKANLLIYIKVSMLLQTKTQSNDCLDLLTSLENAISGCPRDRNFLKFSARSAPTDGGAQLIVFMTEQHISRRTIPCLKTEMLPYA